MALDIDLKVLQQLAERAGDEQPEEEKISPEATDSLADGEKLQSHVEDSILNRYGLDPKTFAFLLDELALQGQLPATMIHSEQHLYQDLGLNQLMLYAVIAEWERILQKRVPDAELMKIETVGELLDLYLRADNS